jgi:hypothetical protein
MGIFKYTNYTLKIKSVSIKIKFMMYDYIYHTTFREVGAVRVSNVYFHVNTTTRKIANSSLPKKVAPSLCRPPFPSGNDNCLANF